MRSKFFRKITAFVAVFCCTVGFCATSVNAAEISDESSVSAPSIIYSTDSSLPSSYSSKDLGYVTEVKTQIHNDCWAYASLATYESMLLRNGYLIDSMSVSHLNAWATTRTNGKGWLRNYSNDGYADIATGYLTSWQGGVESSIIGNVDLTTQGDLVATNLAKYGVTAIEILSKENPNAIKQQIMENGGVYSAYASNSSCTSKNRTSYFMPNTYTGSYTGHAIEIVGWDDNYAQSNFDGTIGKKPVNPGAWLVKNSWGNYNSMDGYFWISYEDKYIFSDKFKPSYSIKEVEIIDETKKLIQNEIYGATYEFGYVQNDNITYINKLDFDKDYSNLDKVVFETESLNADYTIHYVPVENDKPVVDKNQWTTLHNGITDYKGYICVDITDFELPDTTGAIAITIDTSELNEGLSSTDTGYVQNSLGVGEWLTSSGKYVFLPETEYGDSYIYYDNNMTDLLDWYKVNFDDEIGGTFVIKAITTKKVEEPALIGDVNLDGRIDISDATDIQKYLADRITFDEAQKKNADFNNDGLINISDATAIQKHLVN